MMELKFTGQDLADILTQVSQFMHTQSAGGRLLEPQAKASTEQTQPANTPAPDPDLDASVEDIAAALKAHMKKHGKDSAINILGEFDARRASEVPADQRGAIISRLQS